MPSTKIINVLRDDSFGEILDIFKNASAKEVIFVLPKTCKAFKDEKDFMILSEEASQQDKAVSFLCSNPDINKIAKKYSFEVLLAKGKSETNYINTVNEYSEPSKTKAENPWGDRELPGFAPVVAAVKTKKVTDVITQDKESVKNLKVKPKKEKTAKVAIDIDNVWNEQERREASSNIWADRIPKIPKISGKKFKLRINFVVLLAVIAAVLL